ncbi:MAG: alpha/beta fold hydrolase [Planctomycetota bacterium]
MTSPVSAQMQELRIAALDGYPLAATLLAPTNSSSPRGLVIIHSATGVPRRYYFKFAEFLCEHGFAVLTYDYRGIGESRPPRLRDFPARMSDWGLQDIPGILDWALEHYPNVPRLAVGHSVGGQMFGIAPNNHTVDAFLCVASQNAEWRLWPGLGRYRLALVYYLAIPSLTRLFGYFPSSRVGMGEDLPPQVALEWARIGRTKGYIRGALGDEFAKRFENFTGPMLAYSFSDDWYAPREAVKGLLDFYDRASRQHRHLRPADIDSKAIGHFGFFRPPFRETLWRESVAWLKAPHGSSPNA